jgi:hypothetical protein
MTVGLLLSAKNDKLECLGKRDVFELTSRETSFEDVAAVERSAKTGIRRALRGHERMFARQS